MSQQHKDLPQADYLEGRYANAFQVGHKAFEFLLDFGQVAPESEQPHFHTRIITSPVHAKALAETLWSGSVSYGCGASCGQRLCPGSQGSKAFVLLPKRWVVETAFFRLKPIFGATLRSRNFTQQTTELFLRATALNRMTHLGMPQSYQLTLRSLF